MRRGKAAFELEEFAVARQRLEQALDVLGEAGDD